MLVDRDDQEALVHFVQYFILKHLWQMLYIQ